MKPDAARAWGERASAVRKDKEVTERRDTESSVERTKRGPCEAGCDCVRVRL